MSSFYSFPLKKEIFKFVVLPCFDLGLTVPMYVPMDCLGHFRPSELLFMQF